MRGVTLLCVQGFDSPDYEYCSVHAIFYLTIQTNNKTAMKKLLLLTGFILLIFTNFSQKDFAKRDSTNLDSTNLDSTKIKTILTNLATSTSNPNGYSPELSPISPNAAGFGKFGVIDINPSTGLANIGVKVFSLKAGDIPIDGDLRYFSAGVKPNEHPGWVGQNMFFNVGAIVSRKVNGGVDEVSVSTGINPSINNAYAFLYNYGLLNVSDWYSDAKLPTISCQTSNCLNLQPDEFVFTLLSGETGSFFLNHLGNWEVKSKNSSGFKVTVDVATDVQLKNAADPLYYKISLKRIIYKITITDMNGFKYTFGNTMDAIEFTRGARGNYFKSNNEDITANAWYLTKVESPTNKVVNFDYVRKEYQYIQSANYPTTSQYTSSCGSCSGTQSTAITYSGQILSPVYLNGITADNFTVNFGIGLTNELPFSYFNSSFNNQNGQWNYTDLEIADIIQPSNDINTYSKWYQLNTITIKDASGTLKESYSFVYSNDATKRLNLLEFHKKSTETGKEDQKHIFTYDTTPLPAYNSLKTDKWGYYNNKQYPLTAGSNTIAQLNAFLEMDATYAQAGILKRVTYPTGGYTDFTYEANDYSKVIQRLGAGTKNSETISLLSQTGIGDGLRVKKVIDYDNLGNSSNSKEYQYKFAANATSSGISAGLRNITFDITIGNPVIGRATIISTFDAQALSFTEGKDIVYSEVSETLLDGSSKVYKYSNSDTPEYLDEIPLNTYSNVYSVQTNTTGGGAVITYTYYSPSSYTYPNFAVSSRGLERGKLLSQETKNAGGTTLHKIINTYNSSSTRFDKFVRSIGYLSTSVNCASCTNTELYYFPVKTYTYIPYLESQKEYVYDQVTTAAFLINSKKFTYDDTGLLLSTTTNESKTKPITLTNGTTLDEDRTIQTVFTYPKDYPSDATLAGMVTKNIIAPVVEKTTELKIVNVSGTITSIPISYEKNTYSLFGTAYLPQKIEVKVGNGTLYTPITFNTYDARSNLTKYTLRNGQINQLTYYGTTDLGKTDLVKTQTVGGGSIGTILSRTMSYDYFPLIGLSSATDINGYSTSYLYDGFNRLISVKDPQNYLLKDLSYHYANQTALSGLGVTPTNTMNYVVSRTAREAQTGTALDSDVDKTTTQLEYMDGLARPLQSQIWKGTPDKLKDIITATSVYDIYGRVYKSILPTPSDALTGAYKSTAQTLATTFYDGDTYPYSETIFEASPLNRPIKQFGAGQAWRTANKFVEMQYQIAGAGVYQFNLQADGSIKWVNTYPTSSLFNNVTVSERGFQTLEVKDRQGRVTHKYQQIEGSFNYLITGYVYNDIGQLIAVIPPEAYKQFGTGSGQVASFTESDVLFKEGIYGYHYDNLGRLSEKHVPGAGWTRFVYDKNDRIVLKNDDQDGNNYWHFTKYDALSRPVMMGLLSNIGTTTRQILQTAFDNFTGDTYEQRGGSLYNYTNTSYPTGSIYTVADADVKIVNYYDDFNWNSDVNYNFQASNAFHSQGLSKGLMTGTLIRNIETSTWQKMVSYHDYQGKLIQDFHFTNRGNLIRKDHQHRFNGELLKTRIEKKLGTVVLSTKIFTYEYDHLGRKSKFKHSLGGNEKTIAKYEYDQIGRMSQRIFVPLYETGTKFAGPWIDPNIWDKQSIPNQNDNVTINAGHTVTIEAGTIANAANLTIKNGGKLQNYGKLNLGGLNGKINNAPSIADPGYIGSVYNLDYQHKIRGGLKGINLDASGNLKNNTLFSYRLDYEEGTTGYFDGNISKQSWKSNIDSKERSYIYTYDGASRLKSGTYASSQAGEDYSLNNVNYDANGNITNLSRNGFKSNSTFGLIDNLNYTYNPNSNKILKVDDASNETASFKDVTGNDYDYWLDGSLKKDNNKDITQIDYNYLKLPKQITLTGGRWIKYEYDASGAKLKKTLSTGKVTDYEEDEIYEGGVLYQTAHDEGRIVDGIYEYNITDHLGNLRVAFKDKGGIPEVVQVNHVGAWGEPLESLNYVNTPKISNFTYSTYEKENDFGIGVMDAHARVYDPVTPRFWQSDVMSEKWNMVSPISYSLNNPIRYSDPDGEDVYLFYWVKSNNEKDNSLFWNSVLTHVNDLLSSKDFGKGDIAVYESISDLGELKSDVEENISKLSPTYGKTREFGIWSHAGWDGPIGSLPTSQDQLNNSSGKYQLSFEGWSNINFNWAENGSCSAGFYGCNTGNDNYAGGAKGASFTTRLSGQSNFKNVDVIGQSSSSYPSIYSDYRETTFDMRNGNFSGQSTYMVAAPPLGTLGSWQSTPANPTRVSQNGRGTTNSNGNPIYQKGKKK
jgi:RHS repeat-associated protein